MENITVDLEHYNPGSLPEKYTGKLIIVNKDIGSGRNTRIETFKNGEHHSFNDEPSVVYFNGTKCWHKNGHPHRGHGLPACIYVRGDVEYWINGERVSQEAAETWGGLFPEELGVEPK